MLVIFDQGDPDAHFFAMFYVLIAMVVSSLFIGNVEEFLGPQTDIGWKTVGGFAMYFLALMFFAGVVLVLAYVGSSLLVKHVF